ncbi:MAG: phosphatidate cytidylyltransferase [Clostridia bacterium]|nr:phosphatidate cytidylyltransferase [Clostridia bacterium]
MLKRIITGVIAGGISFAAIYFGGYFFGALITFIAAVALFEYFRAFKNAGRTIDYVPGAVMLLVLPLMMVSTSKVPGMLTFGALEFNFFYVAVLAAMLSVMANFVFRYGKFKIDDTAVSILGAVYIPFMLIFAYCLREMPHGGHLLLISLIGPVSSDTAAFAVGSLIGKHKLCPELSPKKSVEGMIAGFAGSVLGLCFYGFMLIVLKIDIGLPFFFYPILGIVLSGAGQVGDLFASGIKRSCGIKDFGKILPGHGGVMDRIDSYIPCFMVTYVVASLFYSF